MKKVRDFQVAETWVVALDTKQVQNNTLPSFHHGTHAKARYSYNTSWGHQSHSVLSQVKKNCLGCVKVAWVECLVGLADVHCKITAQVMSQGTCTQLFLCVYVMLTMPTCADQGPQHFGPASSQLPLQNTPATS